MDMYDPLRDWAAYESVVDNLFSDFWVSKRKQSHT